MKKQQKSRFKGARSFSSNDVIAPQTDAERRAFVENNKGLVVKLAKRAHLMILSRQDSSISMDDLIQSGNLGLWNGLCSAQQKAGKAFLNHLCWHIRKSIYAAIRDSAGLNQRQYLKVRTLRDLMQRWHEAHDVKPTLDELAKELGWDEEDVQEVAQDMSHWQHASSLDAVLHSDGGRGEESRLEMTPSEDHLHMEGDLISGDQQEMACALLRSNRISPKQRIMLLLRCGFWGREFRLEEIGDVLGVSREYVRKEIERATQALATQEGWKKAHELFDGLSNHPPEEVAVCRRWQKKAGDVSEQEILSRLQSMGYAEITSTAVGWQ